MNKLTAIFTGIIYGFFLKTGDSKYFCLKKEGKYTYLYLCTSKVEGINLEIVRTSTGIGFIKRVGDNKSTFDVEGEGKLILHQLHGRESQQFKMQMVDVDRVYLLNGNKCVEYLPETKYFHLRPCTYNENQTFTIHNNEAKFHPFLGKL